MRLLRLHAFHDRLRNMCTTSVASAGQHASHLPPRLPLILILGPTGTGKSNLALSIASHVPSEIINADAMQMYQGLPIITNKLPLADRQSIPHHLLDLVPLDAKPWTVSEFVKESTKVIQEIRSRGKLPIVVGGTNYYTHALLFKDATLSSHLSGTRTEPKQDTTDLHLEDMHPILSASNEEVYAKLQELDPAAASSWHPNDRRHIRRCLEICLRTGRKASQIYQEQAEARPAANETQVVNGALPENGRSHLVQSPGLRHDPLLLWLNAEDAVLKERLNSRVDDMVSSGLFEEALSLVQQEQDFKARDIAVDKTKGIWVSIGYKEMEAWAEEYLLNPESSGVSKPSQLATNCIEAVKAATRRYGKDQNRYIRIRLANALKDEGIFEKMFLLDSTDLSQWELAVVQRARTLVDDFLEGKPLPEAPSLSPLAEKLFASIGSGQKPIRVARRCEVCNKVLPTEREWKIHIASRSHKKVVDSQRRRLTAAAYINRPQKGTSSDTHDVDTEQGQEAAAVSAESTLPSENGLQS